MFKRISNLTVAIALSLSPRQAAIVAFVSTFVTVIGGIALAIYFKKRNDKRIILWN
jgi:hypothetical protein